MEKKFVITVARGFGSGGKAISVALAKELGVPCYEKEILTMASQNSGISEKLFLEHDEKLKNFILKKLLKPVPPDYTVEPMSKRFTRDDNLYNIQKHIIMELAKAQSCVIVGKCADHVLADNPNILKVFVGAPMDVCEQFIMERMQISEEKAYRMIVQTDRYRSEYYRYYTGGKEWTDPLNYDICLNTGDISREICVDIIKDLLYKKLNIQPEESTGNLKS